MEDEFDILRSGLAALNDPFSPEGTRSLLKNPKGTSSYDNMFESGEIRNVISNTKDSKYLTIWDDPTDLNNEEKKAHRQPWLHKAGAGLGRVGTKVVAEIAKMPGVIGGIGAGIVGQIDDAISGEDNTDFMQTAFNNSWIKAIEGAEEHIKEEVLPVYVKEAIQSGNLWDNITSIDFWATEGADGLGYIISMLAPGQAITKLGIGQKMLGINKITNMASKTKKAEKALNTLNKFGINAKNADLATATIANTLFEAGAEARGAMDAFRNDLDIKLQNGEIDQAKYDELIQQEAIVGRNVFLANAAILVGPNAIMSKMLWGRPTNRAAKVGIADGKLTKAVEPTLKQKAGNLAKDVGLAGSREGFWEEGMQSTVENYYTENPDSNGFDIIGDLGEAYANMLSSTEGQKAIFLGAFFGGGMQGYTGAKSRQRDRKVTNSLVDTANEALSDFANVLTEDIYLKDKDGNVIIDELSKEPAIDKDKVVQKIAGSNGIEKLSLQFDLAAAKGDIETVENIRDMIATHIITPFVVNDNLGTDILRQALETSSQLSKVADIHGYDNSKFIDATIKKAEHLKNKYDTLNELGTSIFKLNEIESTDAQLNNFYNSLKTNYLSNQATAYTENLKLDKLNKLYETILSERGRNVEETESNHALRKDLFTMDSRIEPLYNKILETKKNIKEANDNLNKFWDSKTVQKDFKKYVKESNRLAKENEAKVNQVLDSIKDAKTIDELEAIDTLDDSLASSEIKKAKIERKAVLEKELADKIQAEKDAQEERDTEETAQHNQAVSNLENFNVGEKITIPNTIKMKKFRGVTGTITKVGKDKITIQLENGSTFTIGKEKFTSSKPKETITRSEGGENIDTPQKPTKIEENDTKTFENSRGSRIIITSNNKEGFKMFDNIPDEAVQWERNPRDKTGESFNIELPSETFSENNKKAVEMVKSEDFSDLEFLINHLPLNVKLTDAISVPLQTLPKPLTEKEREEGKLDQQEIFNKSSKVLRTTIIKELAINKANIEDIKVTIEGQANGDLQIAPQVSKGVEAENNIVNLHQYSGELSKVKSTDFYMVDEFGNLVNNNGDVLSSRRGLAPGEIYLHIKRANGKDFPLKLNVKRISEEKAELLYQLYLKRFDDFEGGKIKEDAEGKSTRVTQLPEDVQNSLKTTFKEELDLLGKNFNDITIRDLTDFLIYDATNNIKSQLRFYKGKLKVANKTFNKEDFKDEANKNIFISALVNNKRHQIRFKRHENDTNDLNISESRKYLEYLLRNNILNTNAVTGRDENGDFYPTFAGKTTIYLDSFNVKVKNKVSEFNPNKPRMFNKNLIGTNTGLKKALPGLFSNHIELDLDKNIYVDEKSNDYNRVSNLKLLSKDKRNTKKINPNDPSIKNASKRGNTVDELSRLFFSEIISIEDFIEEGERILQEQNELKPGTTIKMSEGYFIQLYNILEQYKKFFDDNGYTIFANTPSIGGVIGKAGRYAGTLDFLLYKRATKEWFIVDLKTSTSNRVDEYAGEDKFNYKGKDEIQQNGYKELFKQTTGKDISGVFIMPLVSKEDTKETDDYVYSEITMATKDFIFPVDTSKDIYELLNIDKIEEKEPTEKLADLKGFGVETQDEVEEKFADLAGFGVETQLKKDAEPKSTKTTTSKSIDKIIEDTQKAFENSTGTAQIPITYQGKDYMLLRDSFYMINLTDTTVVTDKNEIFKIVNFSNKESRESGSLGYVVSGKEVKTVWDERVKTVKSKIKKEDNKKVIVNKDKMSDADANKIIKNIMLTYRKEFIKDIQNIISKTNISQQEKVEELYIFLSSKGESREEVKTKCGL